MEGVGFEGDGGTVGSREIKVYRRRILISYVSEGN